MSGRTVAWAVSLAFLLLGCQEETLTLYTNPNDDVVCPARCTLGARRCIDADHYETCIKLETGCASWGGAWKCSNGGVCSDGVCHAETSKCEDACRAEASKCENGMMQKCEDVNGDGCLEWGLPQTCAHGCNGEQCRICEDLCQTEYATACIDEAEYVCRLVNGCLEYVWQKACRHGCDGEQCRGECSDACATGASKCEDGGMRDCRDIDGDGCLEWGEASVCEYGCDGAKCQSEPPKPPVSTEKTRYLGNRILSPITPSVVNRMRAIRSQDNTRNDAVFMKMGDSHMAPGSVFMYCFSNQNYDLNGLNLENTIMTFKSEFDSFGRNSLATKIGERASYPLDNNAEILNSEITAVNPRFSFYGFGTNDMLLYGYYKKATASGLQGYFGAMQRYYRYVVKGVDSLMARGIVPLLIGTGMLTPERGDTLADRPQYYVTTMNAISRGVAEYYQIPYYNLQLSQQPLASNNYGLSSDSIHHKSYAGGCVLTSEGMQAGANVRNRYALEMLQKAYLTTVEGQEAPDNDVVPFLGEGTKASPYKVESLPYTHMDSTLGGEKNFGAYSCMSGVSEAGAERIYEMNLTSPRRVRAIAMSAEGVDVDIHLLTSLEASACLVRGDKWVEANLPAGTYYWVIDTFKDDSNAGLYLFAVHECDAEDLACGSANDGE